MRAVRPRAVVRDAALGLVVAWFGWSGAHVAWDKPELDRRQPWERNGPEFGWTDASPVINPLLVLMVLGVAVRTVWPRVSFVAVTLALGGYLAAGAPPGPVFVALALAVFSMATVLPLRRWMPLTALLVPMIIAGHWQDPYLGLLDPSLYAGLLMIITVAVLPTMFALLRRARRDNERREREQDRRRYADEERLRIAREVHDVVGHSLSVITMQAGVALHVLDKRPEQVAESLEAIRKTSKEALAELRTTLDVFRDPDGGAPRGLLPGLARLDDLVAALVGAGREVTVVRDGVEPARLPVAVDQAAFRIIQEALTNVVRHAGSAAAAVRLVQSPARLSIEVSDRGPTTSPPVEGNGIGGMRERAHGVGGTIEVQVGEPSGLVVRAELPLGRTS